MEVLNLGIQSGGQTLEVVPTSEQSENPILLYWTIFEWLIGVGRMDLAIHYIKVIDKSPALKAQYDAHKSKLRDADEYVRDHQIDLSGLWQMAIIPGPASHFDDKKRTELINNHPNNVFLEDQAGRRYPFIGMGAMTAAFKYSDGLAIKISQSTLFEEPIAYQLLDDEARQLVTEPHQWGKVQVCVPDYSSDSKTLYFNYLITELVEPTSSVLNWNELQAQFSPVYKILGVGDMKGKNIGYHPQRGLVILDYRDWKWIEKPGIEEVQSFDKFLNLVNHSSNSYFSDFLKISLLYQGDFYKHGKLMSEDWKIIRDYLAGNISLEELITKELESLAKDVQEAKQEGNLSRASKLEGDNATYIRLMLELRDRVTCLEAGEVESNEELLATEGGIVCHQEQLEQAGYDIDKFLEYCHDNLLAMTQLIGEIGNGPELIEIIEAIFDEDNQSILLEWLKKDEQKQIVAGLIYALDQQIVELLPQADPEALKDLMFKAQALRQFIELVPWLRDSFKLLREASQV